MINPQLFFVKGTIGDLKRVAAKYPGVRRLYARTDNLRAFSVIHVFASIVGHPEAAKRLDSVWNTAVLTQSFHEIPHAVARLLRGYDANVSFIENGSVLPRTGLGFAYCPTMPTHTSAILLDDMRIMKWCSATCVPTFGLAKTLADTVLIHAEA